MTNQEAARLLRDIHNTYVPESVYGIALEVAVAVLETPTSDGALGLHGEVERVTCDACGAQVLCGAFKPSPVTTNLHGQRDYQALYYELIYLVGNKYPGETRHQTAMRYLMDREKHGIGEPAQAETARVGGFTDVDAYDALKEADKCYPPQPGGGSV